MLGRYLENATPADLLLLFLGIFGAIELLMGLFYWLTPHKRNNLVNLYRISNRVYLNEDTQWFAHRYGGYLLILAAIVKFGILLPYGWLAVMGAGNTGDTAFNIQAVFMLAGLLLFLGVMMELTFRLRRTFDKDGNAKRPIPPMFKRPA